MKYIITTVLIGCLTIAATLNPKGINYDDKDEVQKVIEQLGGEALPHKADLNMKGVSVQKGMELLTTGITTNFNDKKTKPQSNHFLCTSCHNMLKEDPDLANPNPEDRLDYAVEKGLPFLQGTTLYGIINRTSFYNDQYIKKYADLVKDAHNDIRNAIRVCATTCAQGRELEDWEVESILAYFEKTGLKMGDLNINAEERSKINKALENNTNTEEALSIIKSKYLSAAPAKFVAPPENRTKGPEGITTTNVKNGEAIYKFSCLHCHENKRFSLFELGDDQLSKSFLDKHFNKYTRYSTYQVVRWGTSPIPGKKAYMPNYTADKMSVQQLEDLKAYLTQSKK
jgi:mono/diheme cytochrome c family protein